jgi:soluble lytic murein transglycosylase-like protein
VVALGSVALAATVAALGRLADMLAGTAGWLHLVGFATAVLGLGILTAVLLTGWLALRLRLARWTPTAPATAAILVAGVAAWLVSGPKFQADVSSLRMLVGGRSETQRETIAHQVYAAYRRSDLTALLRLLERARVYEPTILEAAATFDVDPEVLMGVAAAESAFYPRDSADGGRGLFQITAAPAEAVTDVKRRLGVAQIDPLNQRHNAFLAAATLRRYLDEMHGDPFLGLLAYNIGPRNGGLRAVMQQYGARDFATVQPYLTALPREYPIRVLSAALAYRLWRIDGRLPRYEDAATAQHIQSVGIPGLTVAVS